MQINLWEIVFADFSLRAIPEAVLNEKTNILNTACQILCGVLTFYESIYSLILDQYSDLHLPGAFRAKSLSLNRAVSVQHHDTLIF